MTETLDDWFKRHVIIIQVPVPCPATHGVHTCILTAPHEQHRDAEGGVWPVIP